MFRCGAREAVRALLVFPQIAQICADAVRGRANPADRAQARQMPQMPFGVLLVVPQIAQICTDAVRGVSCFPADGRWARSKREFCYNVTCYMLQ